MTDDELQFFASVVREGLDTFECAELQGLVRLHAGGFVSLTAGRRFRGTPRQIGMEVLRLARLAANGGES